MTFFKLDNCLGILYSEFPENMPRTPKRVYTRARTMTSSSTSGGNMAYESSNVASITPTRKRKMGTLRGRPLSKKQRVEVQRIVSRRQELKLFVTNNTAGGLTNVPIVLDISAVPQGSTDAERDGDRLFWQGWLDFNYTVSINQANVSGLSNLRVIVFQWHPNSVPTAATILLAGPSGGVDIYSQYGHDNRQLFCIIHDRLHALTGSGVTANLSYTNSSSMAFLEKIPLGAVRDYMHFDKTVQFVTGSTTGTNRIYILFVSDQAGGVGAVGPALNLSTKLVYRDG